MRDEMENDAHNDKTQHGAMQCIIAHWSNNDQTLGIITPPAPTGRPSAAASSRASIMIIIIIIMIIIILIIIIMLAVCVNISVRISVNISVGILPPTGLELRDD